jgi:hypothetical protein
MLRLLAAATAIATAVAVAPRADKLAVYDRGAWHTWWESDAPRDRWDAADPTLMRAVHWQSVRKGIETAELRIAARAPAIRVRLILVRIDAHKFDWSLVETRTSEGRPQWEVESAASNVAFAVNAGQFANTTSWGWLIRGGVEVQAPGRGPLSMALVVDTARNARLVTAGELAGVRERGGLVTAFQSYPALLVDDGVVPEELRAGGTGVDLRHRDSRLAIGELRDGKLLVALTRYDIGGGLLRPVPIGPNTPEMAAIMGALGCKKAMMLDGGISSQLLVRDAAGRAKVWSAYRWVPLGLVAVPN